MFGNLDLDFHRDTQFRLYRCSLCDALGSTFGSMARLLTNNEMALCLAVAATYGEFPMARRRSICPALSIHQKLKADHAATLFLAAITVVLAYEKLVDDIYDGDRNPLGTIKRKLLKWREKAEDILDQQGFPVKRISEAFHRQRTLERSGITDLLLLSEQTASVMEYICGHLPELVDRSAMKTGFSEIGNGLGRLIYVFDAAFDVNKDKCSGAFNPFLSCNAGADKFNSNNIDEVSERVSPLLKQIQQEMVIVVSQMPLNPYITEIVCNRLNAKIERLDKLIERANTRRETSFITNIAELGPLALLTSPRLAFADGGGGGAKCMESVIFLGIMFVLYTTICRGMCGGCCSSRSDRVTVDHGCAGRKTYRRDPCTGRYKDNSCC